MCRSKTVIEVIEKEHPEIVGDPRWTAEKATAEDIEQMQREIDSIKQNMATKQDILELQKQIIPLAQDAAKWGLVKAVFASPKTYLIIAMMTGVMFGVRYLSVATGIFDKL